jgi:uncharacterized protein (TIGR02246 family)
MYSFKLSTVPLLLLAIMLFAGCQRSEDPSQVAGGQGLESDGEKSEVPPSSASDETSGAPDDGSADQDKAIMKLVDSYVTAFNMGDAAAVVEHWSKDGVYVNRTTGDQLVGREAIEASFREMFADGPVGELQVEVESIRIVRPDVALEDGTARFVAATGPVDTTSYTAIYVREENEWKLDSIRETASPSPPTNYDMLSECEWMVGYWTDELDEWQVETNCEWSANRNFLTRSFKVVKDDQTQIQGVQVIGYDPIANAFWCWVFHSGGGFGEGTVEVQNDRLVLTSAGDEPQETQLGYYPIHRSSEGKWTIDTIGEVSLSVAQPSMENMKELEWMVGQWVDQDDNATIETTCSWTPNKAFLRRSFKVAVQDRVNLAGLQVIGWDADAEEFRSWVFDSAGGFASDQWSNEGDRWIIKSAGVLFGGQQSSTVRIITPIDDDSFTLEAVHREVGGELLPDIDKVTVVRKKSSE